MPLSESESDRAIYCMRKYGGSFVKALAQAYSLADASNRERLETAFEDYFQEYLGRFSDATREV